MLIKMPSGWVSSHLFGEVGAVFGARPVALLLQGSDAGRELPVPRPHRAPWVQRNYLAFPGTATPASSGMPEGQPRSPSQCGDILGAPRGSGCRGTICPHPWASLTLRKLNSKKREKKENMKTRHFWAFNSPAIGNSLMCIYH